MIQCETHDHMRNVGMYLSREKPLVDNLSIGIEACDVGYNLLAVYIHSLVLNGIAIVFLVPIWESSRDSFDVA